MERREVSAPTFYPSLLYEDASAALGWLVDAFGFVEKMRVPGPEGTIAHAELSYGSGIVMLGSTANADDVGPPSARQSVYVAIEDPDAHHDRAKAAGARIVRELVDTDYGSRDYAALDPEGHLWNFGTYRPEA